MCIATNRRLPYEPFLDLCLSLLDIWSRELMETSQVFRFWKHWTHTCIIRINIACNLKSHFLTCTSSVQLIWSQDEISSTYIPFWSNTSSLFVVSSSKQGVFQSWVFFFFLMIPSLTDLLHKPSPSSSSFSQSRRKSSVPETAVLLVFSYPCIL